MKQIELPNELEPFRASIEKSKTNFVEILAKETSDLSIKQSKFGGYPFLPEGVDYPFSEIDNESNVSSPMILLAQINFKELPENDIFPNKGILQIYIGDDDFYGCGKYSSVEKCKGLVTQKNFKIFYHEDDTVAYQQKFDFLDDIEREASPLGFENEQYGLSFKYKEEYVPNTDKAFKDFLGQGGFEFFEQFGSKGTKPEDKYSERINSLGHKMGGYGFIIGDDPRTNCEAYKDYILLLQIDSEDEIGWGDCGSAQFFIDKEALKNLDFSIVVYYWACF